MRATSRGSSPQRRRSTKPLPSTVIRSRSRHPSAGRRSSRRIQTPSGRLASGSPATGSSGRSYSANTCRARPRSGPSRRNVTPQSDGRRPRSSVSRRLMVRAMARSSASRSAATHPCISGASPRPPGRSITASGNSPRRRSYEWRARSPASGSNASNRSRSRASAASMSSSPPWKNRKPSTTTRKGSADASPAAAAAAGSAVGASHRCSSRAPR